MKTIIAISVLLASAGTAFGQESELPTEKKTEKKRSYYYDDDPPNAFHHLYSDIYTHRWLDAPHDGMEPISQAEQDRISDVYIADCIAKEKYARLMQAYIYRKMWDKAIEIAPKGIEYYKTKAGKRMAGWDLVHYGQCYLDWADALLGAGRKEEARAKLEEMIALNIGWAGYYNGGREAYPNPAATAKARIYWFEEDRLDKLGLPKWTDHKAFPEPQQAKYEDEFTACPKLTLVLDGIEETDGRIELLKLKLRRRGFEFAVAKEPGDYTVEISLDPKNCRVKKPEGYTLDASGRKTVIVGNDVQGVLWGVVSFLQILDPVEKRMRKCSLDDWPACHKRGYLGGPWTSNCEFAVFNKLNYITLKPHPLQYAEYTPLNLMAATEQAKEFNDLGLTLFYDNRPMTMDRAWPLCWNVTLARMIEDAKVYAKCGVGLYFGYDDARYWESAAYTKEDQATGLKPSDYDAPFLAKLYKAVKAEYPNFKMQFCPPFYWGPNAKHPYPDDRDKYLKSLATHLPKEIDVFWSGERVGSHTKTPFAVRWFSGLIGRKPSLYQNKTGPHYYLSYVVDATHWEKWFYPGFVDRDMESIQKNAGTPTECPQITTLADYCWNPKAYDADRSIKRGLDQYAGKGLFELLMTVYPKMCYYDKYKYGRYDNSMRWEDVDRIRQDIADMERVTEEAKILVGTNFMNSLGNWGSGIGFAKHALANVIKCKVRDYRVEEQQYLSNNVVSARTSLGYDEEKDVLLDGMMFRPLAICNNPNNRRTGGPLPTTRIAADFSWNCTGTATFDVKELPKPGDETLLRVLAYSAVPAKARIVLNGVSIFEGALFEFELGSAREYTASFIIPEGTLKKSGNTLEITTLGTPIELVDCVIRSRANELRRDKVFSTLGLGGYQRGRFDFEGYEGTVIEPSKPAEDNRWVWIMGSSVEDTAAAKELLEAGYRLVLFDDSKRELSKNSPVLDRDLFRRRFQRYLVGRFGLREKCGLLSGTAGAEEVLGYASLCPQFVTGVVADFSKVDFPNLKDFNKESLYTLSWRLGFGKVPVFSTTDRNLDDFKANYVVKFNGRLLVRNDPPPSAVVAFFDLDRTAIDKSAHRDNGFR